MNSIDLREYIETLYSTLSKENLELCLEKMYQNNELVDTYFLDAHVSQNSIVAFEEGSDEFLKQFWKNSLLYKQDETANILSEILDKVLSNTTVEHEDKLPVFTYTL